MGLGAEPGDEHRLPPIFRPDPAALSVEKKINSLWFVRGGVGAADIQYEAAPTGLSSALGGMDYNGFLRTGYWVTPQFNAFVEGGADLHRYGDSWYDSNSYRIIGGLSSDLISCSKAKSTPATKRWTA